MSQPAAFDLVIEGGLVLDGSGRPGVTADVGIRAGRVAAIGSLEDATAARRVDASGRVVAPGFVDVHSHSDLTLLVDPGAGSAIAQGVTTEVVGNCGHGCAPLGEPPGPAFTANIYGWGAGAHPLDWRTVAGYLDRLEAARPAVNVGTLVPFGNLRLLAVADLARPARPDELVTMARALEAGLEVGALGLSTGLEYPAEHAAPSREVGALVRQVGERGGLHAIHTRDRGRHVVESTREAIAIARGTGTRTQVSHILARRRSVPPDADAAIVAALEAAAADGLPIAWDVHTRRFGITNLSTALSGPDPAPGALRVGPQDEGVIASFGRAGWERTFILDGGPGWEALRERSVADLAAERGEPVEALLLAVLRDALRDGDLHRPMAIGMTYEEEAIVAAIGSSRCAVGSDGTTMDLGSAQLPRLLPGAFTWAAWFLRRVVGELGALSLPEAVARVTRLPADQAGLADRGRLAPGVPADVVVFDPAAIREPADPIRPVSLAAGMDLVLVNGVVALEAGRPTGARAGRVLRA